MNRSSNLATVAFITATVLFSTPTIAQDLVPASELKAVSAKATERVIAQFLSEGKTKSAYEETKSYIASSLQELAEEGFYDVRVVQINAIEVKAMKYNKLNVKQKDMLETILKRELQKLGYTVESARYDNIGLHWAISWGK